MFENLTHAPRLLLEAVLTPVQGARFQPTGFPDIGAARYLRPQEDRDDVEMILVESAQSVANRLEATCIEQGGVGLSPELAGLPYVLVQFEGAAEGETSSLFEAHRINSPFIIGHSDFDSALRSRLHYAKGKIIDWRKVAAAFFALDPNSLLHGAFLSNFEDGRIRLPRLISGFIEAEDVREVPSGGVKNNPQDPSGKIVAEYYDKAGVYSNVPYHRSEFTARRIVAYFNFDLAALRGTGLHADCQALLLALGLLKVRRFLAGGLRLRTACDLEAGQGVRAMKPTAFAMPDEAPLLSEVQRLIKSCATQGFFADPSVTILKARTKVKDDKRKPKEADSESELVAEA